MSLSDGPELVPRRRPVLDLLAIVVMACATVWVYWPPASETALGLGGSDWIQLHQYRMSFARDAIFGDRHALPAWYPRELLGTPFWSNVQNFPFIPSRLVLFALLDPSWEYTYAVAIGLSAVLSALSAFAFCRAIGLGAVASSTAGWTFACCGYFASRVTAGHLPLLEAYPGLPLLLFLVERLNQSRGRADHATRNRSTRRWLRLLAIACCALALAGHPQLPIYSFATAGIYAIWRGWGHWRGIARSLAVMCAGMGCAGFALVPMLLLVARSTRVLRLQEATNNIALPPGRILGFWQPWRDGAAPPALRSMFDPFRGYPEIAYFWDSVCYAGWIPWIAIAATCIWLVATRDKPNPPVISRRIGWFIVAMGFGAVVLALPFVQRIMQIIPGTIIRSPVRLLYVTELAVAVALGVGIQLVIRHIRRPLVAGALLLPALAIHIWDLRGFDREFMLPLIDRDVPNEPAIRQAIVQRVGDGRVSMDLTLNYPLNRKMDDPGFFDSVFLAKPYAAIMSLGDAPPGMNNQMVSVTRMKPRALRFLGVKAVVSNIGYRNDLLQAGEGDGVAISAVPDAAPRAELFSLAQIDYLDAAEIHRRLRDPDFDLARRLALPDALRPATAPDSAASFNPAVSYERPSSDRVVCKVSSVSPGFLRIIESWDPGWSVTVSGMKAETVIAWDSLLAVTVPAGEHEVVFTYHTPGVATGIAVSIGSIGSVIALTQFTRLKAEARRTSA